MKSFLLTIIISIGIVNGGQASVAEPITHSDPGIGIVSTFTHGFE